VTQAARNALGLALKKRDKDAFTCRLRYAPVSPKFYTILD